MNANVGFAVGWVVCDGATDGASVEVGVVIGVNVSGGKRKQLAECS